MNIPTPPPIRRAIFAAAVGPEPKKLPRRVFPWRRIGILILAGFVIGNGSVTLWSYAVGKPDMSAWTGHTAQSTPSAVNDILLATQILLIALYLLRKTGQ